MSIAGHSFEQDIQHLKSFESAITSSFLVFKVKIHPRTRKRFNDKKKEKKIDEKNRTSKS